MNKLNILFLGGGKRVSIAEHFINSGKKFNFEVEIFSYELIKQMPIASIANVIIGLKWDNRKIIDDLLRIVTIHNVNIIIPFVDPAVKIAAILQSKLSTVFIPVSSSELCDIMYDKVIANEWFIDKNIPVPEQEFPLIAKPRKGSASKGIIKLGNKIDFINFEKKYDKEQYLIQQFITGKEYSVDCYVSQKGVIIGIVPRIRLEVSGGEAIRTRTIKHLEIIKLSEQILTNPGFSGPITIQFIEELQTNKVFLMEINPRFGGGVLTSINAGADYVKIMLEEYQNHEVLPLKVWKENFLMTRYFKEIYFDANNN